MQFQQNSFDDLFQNEISREIAKFAAKHGGVNAFKEQKYHYDIFTQKVPNNGYKSYVFSPRFGEPPKEISTEIIIEPLDYEAIFLESWKTEIFYLDVLTAEPVVQYGMPCWYVIYQFQSETDLHTVITKFWEHRTPQNTFYKNPLG